MALLAVVAVPMSCVVGCGAAKPVRREPLSAAPNRPVAAAGAPSRAKQDRDGDEDTKAYHEAPGGLYDGDDGPTRYFGHEASAADGHAIETLVRGYYRAISRREGSIACSALEASLAGTLADSAAPGAPRGGCPAIVPTLFENVPGRPVASFAHVAVVGARVMGSRALVLVRTPAGESGYLELGRESGHWRLSALLDERPG